MEETFETACRYDRLFCFWEPSKFLLRWRNKPLYVLLQPRFLCFKGSSTFQLLLPFFFVIVLKRRFIPFCRLAEAEDCSHKEKNEGDGFTQKQNVERAFCVLFTRKNRSDFINAEDEGLVDDVQCPPALLITAVKFLPRFPKGDNWIVGLLQVGKEPIDGFG